MKNFIKASLVVMVFVVGVSVEMKPNSEELSSFNLDNLQILNSANAESGSGDAACYRSDPNDYCDQNGSFECFWTSMPVPGAAACSG